MALPPVAKAWVDSEVDQASFPPVAQAWVKATAQQPLQVPDTYQDVYGNLELPYEAGVAGGTLNRKLRGIDFFAPPKIDQSVTAYQDTSTGFAVQEDVSRQPIDYIPKPPKGLEGLAKSFGKGIGTGLFKHFIPKKWAEDAYFSQGGAGIGGFLGETAAGLVEYGVAATALGPAGLAPIIAGHATESAMQNLEETDSIASAVTTGTLRGASELLLFRWVGTSGIGGKLAESVQKAVMTGSNKAATQALVQVSQAAGIGLTLAEVEGALDEAQRAILTDQTFEESMDRFADSALERGAGGALSGVIIAGGGAAHSYFRARAERAYQTEGWRDKLKILERDISLARKMDVNPLTGEKLTAKEVKGMEEVLELTRQQAEAPFPADPATARLEAASPEATPPAKPTAMEPIVIERPAPPQKAEPQKVSPTTGPIVRAEVSGVAKPPVTPAAKAPESRVEPVRPSPKPTPSQAEGKLAPPAKAKPAPVGEGKRGVDLLMERYEATGRVAVWVKHRKGRRDEISLNGVTMSEKTAVAKMKELLAEPAAPQEKGEITEKPEPTRKTPKRRGLVTIGGKKAPIGDVEQSPDGFDIPSEGVWHRLRRRVQDKMLRLRTAQEAVVKQGGTIEDRTDAYLGEELFQGKVEDQLIRFEKATIDPMVRDLRKAKLTANQLGEYLYAKFAPARNARIADINPDMPEGGSGMSDAKAAEIIERFQKAGDLKNLEVLAKRIYEMNVRTREILVEGGLISQEQSNQWAETQGPLYVPLRTDMENLGAGNVVLGKGFDIRGKESKAATGRQSLADNPLMFAIMQHDAAIIRAEKNGVGQRLLQFVKDNPDPKVWKIVKAPTKAVIDKDTGVVVQRHDPLFKLADNVVSVKVEGKENLIEFKGQAELIARAMKNMGVESTGSIINGLLTINRYLSTINTAYNPEFVLTNFTRDIQTAGINITSTESTAMATKILKNVFPAMKGAYQAIREQGKDAPPTERPGKWVQHYHEYTADGGKVGWFHAPSLEQVARDIEWKMRKATPGEPAKILSGIRGIARYIMDVNLAVENAVRLAAYVEMKKSGMSRERAASFAKNLTVNFNRKGEIGQYLNAFYLFANAGIQGTSIFLARTIKTPRGRKIAAGIVAGSFALSLLNYFVGGEDDDGENFYSKIPDYVKERNLIIMLPQTGGRYLSVPLPYGYNVFNVLGVQAQHVTSGERTIGESTGSIVNAMLGSFNPLGSEAGLVQTISPTVFDPFVQIETNQTFYGAPIKPEQTPYGPEKPQSQLYWDSVTLLSKSLSEQANRFTGGDKVTPGLVDVSPELIDHIVGFVTGGAGKTVQRTVDTIMRLAKGDELPMKNIPFIRRFTGEAPEFFVSRKYYENRDILEQAVARAKYYIADKDPKSLAKLRKEHGWILSRRRTFNEYNAAIQKINKTMRALPEDKQKTLESKKDRLQRRANNLWKGLAGRKIVPPNINLATRRTKPLKPTKPGKPTSP